MSRTIRNRYNLIANELVGISDIAEAVGVSVPAVSNWTNRWDDFPPCLDRISGVQIWARDEVHDCLVRHGRDPRWALRIR